MKRPMYDLPARALCYRQNYLQIFVGWNSLPCRLRASKVEQLDSELREENPKLFENG